jgi:hypothetical protein
MANAGSITPYFTIWTEPRATIRRIVDTDPTRNVIALAAIGPAIGALSFEYVKAKELGSNNISLPWAAAFVAAKPLLGILNMFIGGVVLKWTGSMLGGAASAVELRAAIAWPQVISIAGGIISLLYWIVLGMPVVHFAPRVVPQIDHAFTPFAIVGGLIAGTFAIWRLIVWLKCIGEVHRFSAWRALAATLIPGLVALAAFTFVDTVFAPLMHR